MTAFDKAFSSVFDLLLRPFRDLPPVAGLSVVSLLTAIGLLLVYRYTSDQQRIEAVKRSIHAALFEVRLFNDDLRAILRAQMEILQRSLAYLRLSLVPMAWIAAPLVLVMAQLQVLYGYDRPGPGEPILVKAVLREAPRAEEAMRLEAPAGIRVETPAVWIPATREVVWRVAAERDGRFELRVRVGDENVAKAIDTRGGVVRRSPVRTAPGLLTWILYPSEPPLASGSRIEALSVGYRAAQVKFLGWETHWMVVFFVLTMVFTLLLRGVLGVTV